MLSININRHVLISLVTFWYYNIIERRCFQMSDNGVIGGGMCFKSPIDGGGASTK